MISRGRKRRGYWQRRRRKQNLLLPILSAVALVVVLGWGLSKTWNALGQGKAQQASAEMKLIQGSTQFALAQSEDWVTNTNQAAKLISGDKIQTQNNSEASLSFLDRSLIFLNENTQISIDKFTKTENGKNTVELTVHKGQVWAKIDDGDFGKNTGSSFIIHSPNAKTYIEGTVLDISTTENQDTIRLINGKANVDIFFGEDKKESSNIAVGVGQKLIVNESSIEQMQAGKEIIESIDPTFQESQWHITHLEQFFPEEAATIKERIQQSKPEVNIPATEEEGAPANIDPSIEAPVIISPENGASIPAAQVDLIIEGTAPAEAEFVTVNNYTLTKYIPGDRKWSYFAAKKFGTLVPGENTYTVVATTRDGRSSPITVLKVNYEGTNEPQAATPAAPGTTEATDTSAEITEATIENSDFPKPVVTRPATGSFNDPFQTSSKIITITGTVDPATQSVEVNGFKLRKFLPGNTEFSYIANANYGNLKEGLNTFTIKAFGPENKISQSEVQIIYTPVEIQ